MYIFQWDNLHYKIHRDEFTAVLLPKLGKILMGEVEKREVVDQSTNMPYLSNLCDLKKKRGGGGRPYGKETL